MMPISINQRSLDDFAPRMARLLACRPQGTLAMTALLVCFLVAGPALVAPTPAMAQGMADVASGLRTNPDAPIEIEADQLDIFDKDKIAVFKGSVRAKQGETTLQTSTLTIHYAGGGAGTAQSITRLEAQGGVTVSQKDQKATGSAASVDMASEIIILSGNVVLTQGKNVLRGSKLTINMRSGAAQLASSGASNGSNGKSGRVQGLFIPNRKPKN
ncbi:LptA/OstA family protein [uncultured Cohaesibacter sp.]|uniref:LptA/OstA family protein n=1 Tax=uncultured Cohaesibacter sp. TaxID=1002546 RepID=UPI0029C85263|nr:LptA/OstA family protein [uncultured Cohaesibacter sp.]